MAIKILTINVKEYIAKWIEGLRAGQCRDASATLVEIKMEIEHMQRILEDEAIWEYCDEKPLLVGPNKGNKAISFSLDTKGRRSALYKRSKIKDHLLGFKLTPAKIRDAYYFLYKYMLIEVFGPYNEDEAEKLATYSYNKKRSMLDSLLNQEGESGERKRTVIPQAVRHEVWRRDQAQCVECGSKENLEYDHLIPFSKGGSNTARNLRLLCEKCNRTKSDSI